MLVLPVVGTLEDLHCQDAVIVEALGGGRSGMYCHTCLVLDDCAHITQVFDVLDPASSSRARNER